MTNTWAEDVYRELRTLITVYAGIEEKHEAIWCSSCKAAFRETPSEHLSRHLGAEWRWTSTP